MKKIKMIVIETLQRGTVSMMLSAERESCSGWGMKWGRTGRSLDSGMTWNFM